MKGRILILPSPPNSGSIGSTVKFIGLAHDLIREGFEIAFVLGGNVASLIDKEKFKYYHCKPPIYNNSYMDIRNYVDFVEWTGMADVPYVEYATKRYTEIIRDFKPDLIFTQSNPSACIAGNKERISVVQFASTPSTPYFEANKAAGDRLVANFNGVLNKYHLPKLEHVCELVFDRADKIIVPSILELESDIKDFANVQYGGAILNYSEEGKDTFEYEFDQRPLIFIYTSMGALPIKMYSEIIKAAFQDGKYNVLCSTGFHFQREEIEVSNADNIKFVEYVNINQIIKRCSFVIFHGGQDMMLTTVLNEKPSIVLSGNHFERSYNAAQMVKNNLTYWMHISKFRPSKLVEIVDNHFNTYNRKALHNFSEIIKSYNKNKTCIDIVKSVLSNI